MPNERELVVLTRDIPLHELRAGHSGTLLRRLPGAAGCEVEFLSGDGCTVVRLTLPEGDLTPLPSEGGTR